MQTLEYKLSHQFRLFIVLSTALILICTLITLYVYEHKLNSEHLSEQSEAKRTIRSHF